MKCPNCKTESDGRFCPSCGTPLRAPGNCLSCGAKLAPGARFCTRCGAPASGSASRSSISVPWLVAGSAIVLAIVLLLLPVVRDGGSPPATAAAAPFANGASAGSQPPPLSGSPREQADRLFNRIMQEQSSGNTEQAVFFTPMAMQAYEASEPLDADGLYHLSLIQIVAGDYESAMATANRILAVSATHLLGLAALAEAAAAGGDTARAVDAWNKFLDNLDSERAKPISEYMDHAPILQTYEQTARSMTSR